jgi:hypothetical protein
MLRQPVGDSRASENAPTGARRIRVSPTRMAETPPSLSHFGLPVTRSMHANLLPAKQ